MDISALFKISYGLYIVSSGDKTNGNGFISNTVFQVSADPIKLAACCSKNNYTSDFIEKHKHFSVSVLRQDTDAKVIGAFGYKSGRDSNKMEGVDIHYGQSGVPIVLNDSLSWMECKVMEVINVGTHWMYIAEVIDTQVLDDSAEPMTYAYYRNVKKGEAPKNAPTYVDKSKLEAAQDAAKSDKWKCTACGYIYDESKEDFPFADLSDSWQCPTCGADKEDFEKIE